MSLPEVISRLSYNPARIFNLPAGQITAGVLADIVIIDPDVYSICRGRDFTSKGKNTAFEGWDFNGEVVSTIIDGNIVYSR